jgi:hypothetical protein
MGIPIMIKQTESERNREGQMEAAVAKSVSISDTGGLVLIADSNLVNGKEKKDSERDSDHRETTYQSSHH